jgi:hypothetical protein
MSWLEEWGREAGHKSLRALAHAMKESQHWPPKDERGVETIANKLRDTDKRKDLAWWQGAGKPLVAALADALGQDESTVVERLETEARGTPTDAMGLWPFKLFPALRPLDLDHEPLFPGLPAELVQSGGPREARTWWHAPAGAGKTLVGRWLERRYGWIFVKAERWTEVDLPARGRVFVELGSAQGLTRASLASHPEELRLCVACPHARPEGTKEAKAEDRAVNFVATPPPREWVLPLVDWVSVRVRPGGGFDAGRARELLYEEGLRGLFATPGDLLGFLGALDHLGFDWLDAHEPNSNNWLRLVQQWLTANLERPDRRCPAEAKELLRGKRGTEVLVKLVRERLRRGESHSQSYEGWTALVPQSTAPGVDRAAILRVLDEAGAEAPDRIRALLAPDGGSLIRALCAAGALVEAPGGLMQVQPTWLANVVEMVAEDELFADAPLGLGSLLLSASTSEQALRRLIDEVRRGELRGVEACLTAEGQPLPEHMAALDGAFRAVGLALALGQSLPLELVRRVWTAAMSRTVARSTNWCPRPLLGVTMAGPLCGTTAESAWLVAAFAITRAAARISAQSVVWNPRGRGNSWRNHPTARTWKQRVFQRRF